MTTQASPIQTVLVVDDNAQNRQLASAILTAEGYAVVMAENGLEALARFAERAPDLVLLDVRMPGIDGFETCKRLRVLPGGSELAVVFLTAHGDLQSHKQAMDCGADDFLTKPINRTELLLRVRSLLWVKRLRDDLSQGYNLIRSQRDALLLAQKQKEQCIAYVVHDLKNPLTSILYNAQYLEKQDSLVADHREAARDIVGASESMRRMVMNLLDISRAEDGGLAVSRSAVEIGQLFDEVRGAMKPRLADGSQLLSLEADASSGTVLVDRELVRRLLENLVDNAVKYTPAGGEIQLSARTTEDAGIEIHVADQGPGIAEAHRESIFEKYVRLDQHEGTSRESSRGLGLAFCRLAAEVHGGRIWVTPNKPTGSVFCVYLPPAREGELSAPQQIHGPEDSASEATSQPVVSGHPLSASAQRAA